LKEFYIQEKDIANYISVGDKAIIPVGEPGLPVFSGVRGHNSWIVLADGPSPAALDHDFHVHGIVPSVVFAVKIPDSPKDTFFIPKPLWLLKTRLLSLSQRCAM